MIQAGTGPNPLAISSRLLVGGALRFETAWRIGTGREGQTMSDLGVMLDPEGRPILPGSSIKGKLRSTCESLAHALGLRACMLDVSASGIECASDINHYSRELRKKYRREVLDNRDVGTGDRLAWIERHTCHVCRLFGSPLKAARIRCTDGMLDQTTWAGVVQVRDGVVLDRDSRTAVDGLKYDYEVVPAGVSFAVRFDLENPTEADLALLGVALFEWHSGASLGGFVSRGLGRFRLENIRVLGADFAKAQERINFLTRSDPEQRLSDRGDWTAFFAAQIECLANGATSAEGA